MPSLLLATPYDSRMPYDARLTSPVLLSPDSWRSRPPLDLQKWSKMGHFWGVLRSGIPPRWRVLPKVLESWVPSPWWSNTPSDAPLERTVLIGGAPEGVSLFIPGSEGLKWVQNGSKWGQNGVKMGPFGVLFWRVLRAHDLEPSI